MDADLIEMGATRELDGGEAHGRTDLTTRARGDSWYESPGSEIWIGEACAAVCGETAAHAAHCAAEALAAPDAAELGDDADLCIVVARVLGACTDLLRCPVGSLSLRHTLALAGVAADVAADCAVAAARHVSRGTAWQQCAASCHQAASALDALMSRINGIDQGIGDEPPSIPVHGP